MHRVLITGGNRGIGLALVRAFLAAGWQVTAACRQASPALEESGAGIITGVDVSDPDSVAELAERLRGSPIDLLVNNAGRLSLDQLGEIDADTAAEIIRQFRVNALGPLLVSQSLSAHMTAGGRIAIITSRMGSIADNTSGGAYGYRMSKAAVNAAGVSLAHDLRDRGIAVGLFHPGFVHTEMTDGQGHVEPEQAASMLLSRFEELNLENSGSFWHANGEKLPW